VGEADVEGGTRLGCVGSVLGKRNRTACCSGRRSVGQEYGGLPDVRTEDAVRDMGIVESSLRRTNQGGGENPKKNERNALHRFSLSRLHSVRVDVAPKSSWGWAEILPHLLHPVSSIPHRPRCDPLPG